MTACPAGPVIDLEPAFDVGHEREFYKYYQPIRLGLAGGHGHKDQSSPRQARASPDRALTAFAQLATLRLNCKRSIISFFDRNYQYIVAESTRSLSLQTDSDHARGDQIDYGVTALPKRGSICEHTLSLPFNHADHAKDDSIFFVPDLASDSRFNDKAYTVEHGWRFYAGVPIISPNGYRIGAYCVIDDQPRQTLAPEDIAFMKDMATTVMVHLDMLRSQLQSIKGERMVHGLRCFVEGQHSLGDWEAVGADLDSPNFHGDRPLQWADRQYLRHHDQPLDVQRSVQAHFPSLTDVGISLDIDKPSPPRPSSVVNSSQQSSAEENPKAKKTSPTNHLDPEVKATFGRAANIIRESLQIDAVVIFDATAKSTFGGLVDRTVHERPKRRRLSSGSEAESLTESGTERINPDGVETQDKEDSAKRSEILGISTPTINSAHGDQSARITDDMTEGFVRSLLRRYPHGKVLNFDEDGDSTSGEHPARSEATDDSVASNSSPKKRKRTRSSEAKMIRQLFPGVRSFAIQPMWDSDQKFFSACIAWTLDPHRILTTHSELSYLAAFGDCTMTEVARINAKIADKAKSDFISSISHELRSPLHGILGSVDCLEDTTLDPFQENLVHTLATCGHTLLDTIDHLLDFAKINNFTRKNTQARTTSSGPHNQKQNFALDVDVDLSVVTEEVLETVFAGHDFIRAGRETEQMLSKANKQADGSAKSSDSDKNVSIVVDISKVQDSHWIFRTQAGAWRRILSNLFNNSLKYTSSGFIQVKLDSEPLPFKDQGGKSKVTLSVTDSGKGMSREYLEKSLFTPFAQEDALQPGTGLGLAIISAIIKSMGGTIEVESEEGKGTKTTVTLEMMHIAVKEEDVDRSVITSCANKTQGMKVGFIGFDADSYKKEPLPGARSPENATHRFMTSFHAMCQNWFNMEMQISLGIDQSGVDVFLTTEKGLEQVQDQLEERMRNKSDRNAQSKLADIPLLVICNSVSAANDMMHHPRSHVTGVLSQPCGPRKLAKSLTLCLEAHKNARTKEPMPSVRKILDDSLGESKHLQDSSLQRVLDSGDHVMKEQTREKGHTGDAPLKLPQKDTVEIAQDTSTIPATDTSLLNNTISPTSPVSSAGPPDPFSRTNSGTDKPVRKVLLVDDNRVNLQLLVTYMKRSGHYYKTASDGLEALETYKSECDSYSTNNDNDEVRDPPFDYVLMDLSMPVMDGLTSTRNIRAHEMENNIKPAKVIALTGLASAQAQQEAYSSGIDTFMTKPVKLKELGKMLDDGTLGNEGTKEEAQMAEQKEKEKKIEQEKK